MFIELNVAIVGINKSDATFMKKLMKRVLIRTYKKKVLLYLLLVQVLLGIGKFLIFVDFSIIKSLLLMQVS